MYFETEGTVFEQFKNLASDLNTKKGDIAIYGFGTSAHRAIPVLLSKGFHIIAILDQNPTLKGNVFMGIPVILPEDTTNFDIPLVVTVEFLMWSLIKKLTKKGFHNVIPYYFFIFDQDIEIDNSNYFVIQSFHYEIFRTQKKQNSLLSIDIPVTMRCSLRCRDCSNLMQYFIKPEHTDFSQSEKAIRKFFSLIDFTFDVRVLGGEPFMNPELYKFIDLLSGYSSQYACMWIQTNGTIIPTKKNIETLQKNNDKIFIRISDYQNQHQRIEYLVKLLTEKHIFHEVVYIPAWHDCAHIQDYHRRQEENEKVLKDCAVRDTPTIIDGKIFRCPMSGNAWLLSILPPNVYEYVDILSTTDTDNTLKLKIQTLMQQKYIKACNFCGNRSVNNQIKPAIQTDEPIKYKSYKKLGGVTT